MFYLRLALFFIIYVLITIGELASRVVQLFYVFFFGRFKFFLHIFLQIFNKKYYPHILRLPSVLSKHFYSSFSSFVVISRLLFGVVLREARLFAVFVISIIFKLLWIAFSAISFVLRALHNILLRPLFVHFPGKTWYFFIGFLFSFFFLFLPILFFIFISDLPHPSQLTHGAIPKTTKIYDRNGRLLHEIYVSQNRTPVAIDTLPQDLIHATIAIEDKDFYTHPGFDLRGITRALYENSRQDHLQGGSTITQQLIKSALLTPEPTLNRKVKEIALAFWAERIYEKEEILEMYFNFVPYGGTAWGVNAASETYFGKDVSELTLAESAFLAGLPRAPSIYSPFVGDGDEWRGRQRAVLDAMVREGYVSRAAADAAYSEELAFSSNRAPLLAPHFVMYVKDLLIEKYGIGAVERGGLHVTTTLDLSLQEKVEDIVASEVERSARFQISNGAALITDPRNGDVLSMVGSHDYFDRRRDGNVNVTRMLRQPGSTIKLVTYALALESGYTEATLLNDSPLSVPQAGQEPYRPVNYDGEYHGRVPLRYALANSYNIPAVRVAQDLGADRIVEMGRKMGISSWNSLRNYGLSITLGGAEVTMLDMATAYGAVANEGTRVDLNPIIEVRDPQDNIIYTRERSETRVLSSGSAFILSDILSDNEARSVEFGPDSPLFIPGARVAVKTGTTDEKRDNWTIGFTPNWVVAVWVGNNDNSPMSPTLTSGLSGAAPLWNRVVHELLLRESIEEVEVPEEVVFTECRGKGMYFIAGTENSVSCNPTPNPSPSVPVTVY